MVDGFFPFPESRLHIYYPTICFEIPRQSTVYHPLHCLTKSAIQCDGSIILQIGSIFAWFEDRDNYWLSPCFWEHTARPNIIIYVLQAFDWFIWQLLEKRIMYIIRTDSWVVVFFMESTNSVRVNGLLYIWEFAEVNFLFFLFRRCIWFYWIVCRTSWRSFWRTSLLDLQ